MSLTDLFKERVFPVYINAKWESVGNFQKELFELNVQLKKLMAVKEWFLKQNMEVPGILKKEITEVETLKNKIKNQMLEQIQKCS